MAGQDGFNQMAMQGQAGFRGRGMGMRGMPTRGVAMRGRGASKSLSIRHYVSDGSADADQCQ